MPSEPKRKLAAIMFTDMVGYTALMQDDEPKARKLIQRHRELMKPLIEKHSGIILQYVGDGTFITFDSAIEAVNCGYEIQNELKSDKDLSLRIGIHIGDVVVDGDEVYGDGVNVASRLEPLAEAGGICVSHQVYENIKNQPGIEAVLLGEKALKNVDHPIKIYSLAGKGLKVSKPFEEEEKAVIESKEVDEPISKPASKKLLPWAAGAAVIVLLFVLLWNLPFFSLGDRVLEASGEIRSIAVLPLDNLSNDPQ
ncbi:MAG: adenylate/guanylate cyclase domain-containing protein, partial [Bacteroidetes bacterium]|nr:adenylate/guanylate cyclase domain-containing protein [Bacteroidota bacterium]